MRTVFRNFFTPEQPTVRTTWRYHVDGDAINFMPAIDIRDIPETVLAALKRRAASNSRSLQGDSSSISSASSREHIELDPPPRLELTM
jgi:hypothetical protein